MKKRKFVQITVKIRESQLREIDKLVDDDEHGSRSAVVRIALKKLFTTEIRY